MPLICMIEIEITYSPQTFGPVRYWQDMTNNPPK